MCNILRVWWATQLDLLVNFRCQAKIIFIHKQKQMDDKKALLSDEGQSMFKNVSVFGSTSDFVTTIQPFQDEVFFHL